MKRFKKIAAVAVAVIMILSTVFTLVACIPETASLVKIEISKAKTDYIAGQDFDKASVEVKATYSDNSSKVVTGWTVDKTTLSVGDAEVTVSYTEGGVTQTAKKTITVAAKAVTELSVKTKPSKVNYQAGEKFAAAGLVLTAKYNDGTSVDVSTGYDWDLKGALGASNAAIVVSFGGKTVSIEIKVAATVIAQFSNTTHKVELLNDNTVRVTFEKTATTEQVVRTATLSEVAATKTLGAHRAFEVEDASGVKFAGQIFAGKLTVVSSKIVEEVGDYRINLTEVKEKNPAKPIEGKVLKAVVVSGYTKGEKDTDKYTVELLADGQLRVILASAGTENTTTKRYLGQLVNGAYEFVNEGTYAINNLYYKATIADGKLNIISYKKDAEGNDGVSSSVLKDKDFKAICSCKIHKDSSETTVEYHYEGAKCNGYQCDPAVVACNCASILSGRAFMGSDGKTLTATFEYRHDKKMNVIIGEDKVVVSLATAAKAATATTDAVYLGEFKFTIGTVSYYGIADIVDNGADGDARAATGNIRLFKKLGATSDSDVVFIGQGSYPGVLPLVLNNLCTDVCEVCGGWEVAASCSACYLHPAKKCDCDTIVAGVSISSAAEYENTYLTKAKALVFEIKVQKDKTIFVQDAVTGFTELGELEEGKEEYKLALGTVNYTLKLVMTEDGYVAAIEKLVLNAVGTTKAKTLAENVELIDGCTCKCAVVQLGGATCNGYSAEGACGGYGCPTKKCDCAKVINGGTIVSEPEDEDAEPETIATFELRKDGKLNLIADGKTVLISVNADGEYEISIGTEDYVVTLDNSSGYKLVFEAVDEEAEYEQDDLVLLPVCACNACGVAGHYGTKCAEGASYNCQGTKQCDCTKPVLGWKESVAIGGSTQTLTIELLTNGKLRIQFASIDRTVAIAADGSFSFSTETNAAAFTKAGDNYTGTYNAATKTVTLTLLAKEKSTASATKGQYLDTRILPTLDADEEEVPAVLNAPCACNAHAGVGGLHCMNYSATASNNCSCKAYDHVAHNSNPVRCSCADITHGFQVEVNDVVYVVELREDGKLVIKVGEEAAVTVSLVCGVAEHTHDTGTGGCNETGACQIVEHAHGDGSGCTKNTYSFKIGETVYNGTYTVANFESFRLNVMDEETPVEIIGASTEGNKLVKICKDCVCTVCKGCKAWIYEDKDDVEGECPCGEWNCQCYAICTCIDETEVAGDTETTKNLTPNVALIWKLRADRLLDVSIDGKNSKGITVYADGTFYFAINRVEYSGEFDLTNNELLSLTMLGDGAETDDVVIFEADLD